MCKSYSGQMIFRPAHSSDLTLIQSFYPKLEKQLISEIFTAMTDNLHPWLAGVVSIVDQANRYLAGDWGGQKYGPRLPLSIHNLDGSMQRYATKETELIHEAIIRFNMSDRNKQLLNIALNRHGLEIMMFCCCGDALIAKGQRDKFLNSEEYKKWNSVRSFSDAWGKLEDEIPIDSIPKNTEVGESEIQAYKRIYNNTFLISNKNKVDASSYNQLGIDKLAIKNADSIPKFYI